MQNDNTKKNKLGDMMSEAIGKIHELGDVKTIIGDPIQAGDTTIIPVSKVSFGFASGGSDLPAKQNPKDLFGGGAGAGVTVQPIAFLVVNKDGDVRLMQIADSQDKLTSAIRSVPEVIDKVTEVIGKLKKDKKNDSDAEETAPAAE